MVKCPKCGEITTAMLHPHGSTHDLIDVDFVCPNGHRYFARIKAEDLMEE